jgi:hypothetical protein
MWPAQMTFVTKIWSRIVPVLRLWILLAFSTLATLPMLGFDGHDRANIAYDGSRVSEMDYDTGLILSTGERKIETIEGSVLFSNFVVFLAAKTGERVYAHLDENGNINYYGITEDLKRRAGEHRLDPSKTGETMTPITDALSHDQARTIEGMLIRQRLDEARLKGLITGREPIEEQLQKAGLLNKNRGRDQSRWLDLKGVGSLLCTLSGAVLRHGSQIARGI